MTQDRRRRDRMEHCNVCPVLNCAACVNGDGGSGSVWSGMVHRGVLSANLRPGSSELAGQGLWRLQFALDRLVAPARVLPRHLPGQRRDRRVHGRPSVRARIAPVPADQLPVQRSSVTGVTSRLVRSVLAAIGPGRRAPPVGPAQPGPGVLPPQHRRLLAQHRQLGVLRRRGTRRQHHPPGQARGVKRASAGS